MKINLPLSLVLFPSILFGQTNQNETNKSVLLTAPAVFSTFENKNNVKLESPSENETITEKKKVIKSTQLNKSTNQTLIPSNYNNQSNMNNVSNQIFNTNYSEINWFNKYTSTRNAFLKNDGKIDDAENKELNQVCEQSKNFIPSTFYNNYILLKQNRNNNSSLQYLKNAQKIDPQNSLLITEAAWLAERSGNLEIRNQAISQLNKTGGISELSKLNAALIISAIPENSLLITNGEFDTYPLWFATENKNIYVVSLAMIADKSWLTKQLKSWNSSITIPKGNIDENELFEIVLSSEKPVYTTLSLRKSLINKWSSKLFVFGNFTCLSNQTINNIDRLKSFYLNNPLFEQLISKNSWQNDPYAPSLINFLPGVKVLQQSNQLSNLEKQKLLQIEDKIKFFTSNISNK
jgi:hypothetical protein